MSDIDNSLNRNLNNSNRNENGEDEVERSILRKEEIGINTSSLDPDELRRLVENNPELIEEMKDKSILSRKYLKNEIDTVEDNQKRKAELSRKEEEDKILMQKKKRQEKIHEIDEKDKIIKILKDSNEELEYKITSANDQYRQIMIKLSEKPKEEGDREELVQKLKSLEKEVLASNMEMDQYKKSIDALKNKMEFKINLEKAMNLENILKTELIKGKEIKKEIDSITKMNNAQLRTLNNIDKENRYSEKIEILKLEIKNMKENIKDNIEKNSKQEKYIKTIHEKLSFLENQLKKLTQPKVEIKKNFTKEELKETLESLNSLKLEIHSKRDILKDLNKTNEEKLNSFVSLNKRIEQDFKENDKMNKMLIFKKNELRRLAKNNHNIENKIERMENKNIKKIIQNNGDLTHLFPNKSIVRNDEENIINQTNLPEIVNEDNNNDQDNRPKLFSRNPNKDINVMKSDEDEEDEEDLEKEESENKEYFNQNETEIDMDRDDSNVDKSPEKSREIQNFNVEIY